MNTLLVKMYIELKEALVGDADYTHEEILIMAEECKDAYIAIHEIEGESVIK